MKIFPLMIALVFFLMCPSALAARNLVWFSAVEPFWWCIAGGAFFFLGALYWTINGYVRVKRKGIESEIVVTALERLLPNLDKEQKAALITEFLQGSIKKGGSISRKNSAGPIPTPGSTPTPGASTTTHNSP